MLQVEVIHLILKAKQSVVSNIEALLLISRLGVMVVEINGNECPQLLGNQLLAAH
jgi:hypothetical protein